MTNATKGIDPSKDWKVFENFVASLKPEPGQLGGRYFKASDAATYTMNDIVKSFQGHFNKLPDTQVGKSKQILSAIKSLDQTANEELSRKNWFVQLCTFIKRFFGNWSFNRDKALTNIEAEIQRRKSIPFRLEKNLRFAKEQQANEKPEKFTLSDRVIPDRIECNGSIKKLRCKEKTILGKQVGISSCEGLRNSMQDRDFAEEVTFYIKDKKIIAQVYGVFDGHGGGDEAAEFVQSNLTDFLVEAIEDHNKESLTQEGIWNALKACFKKLDEQVYEQNKVLYPLPSNLDDPDWIVPPGTTVTIAMILEGNLWVANAGDSRAILCDNGTVTQLSEDAKPDIERFARGVEKLGGTIYFDDESKIDRVEHEIAVTRAIGDRWIKGKNAVDGQCLCCISPNPKITCVPLDAKQNGYLILACDGIFDVASTLQVVDAVNKSGAAKETPELIAKRLVYSALKSESQDNLTAIVVKL